MRSAFQAAFTGLARVLGSPTLVLLLWIASLAAAAPLAISMSDSIHQSIGGSLVHQNLREGLDMGWYGEFRARAKGIERTLSPSVVGAGAFLDNLDAWLNGSLFELAPGLVALGVAYGLLWALFLGGILNRYGEPHGGRFRLGAFLSHGAEFFFRFVRLAVLAAPLYYLVYRFAAWIFRSIESWTRDVTAETTILAYVGAASLLVGFLLTFVNLAFDYAKIATYKENRRSMLLAALRGFRLVFANLGGTTTLYYGLLLFGFVLLVGYAWIAPGPGQATARSVVFAFLVGQAFLVAKLMLRLNFLAGALVLYDTAQFRR
jgi:hypothetical protein